MVRKRQAKGKCQVCYQLFPLKPKGQTIPWHRVGITGEGCPGVGRPPVQKPQNAKKPLPDSRDDFEIRITALGHPGTGKRR